MPKLEERIVRFDPDLKIEAYWFKGVLQKFPTHFHEHYLIGFIENGGSRLGCKNGNYVTKAGDMVLFNPRDTHACEPFEDELLDFRGLNINADVMQDLVRQITGDAHLPQFTVSVAPAAEQAVLLRDLHSLIVEGHKDFRKEELLFALLEQLLEEYAEPFIRPAPEAKEAEIRKICAYLDANYAERISLGDLCRLSGLDKYYLLRAFTRYCGVTPYRYLETVRVARAKSLLEEGVPPVETALRAGFADQSHFTKFFKSFIGLTPRQYQRIFINIQR